MSSPGHQQQAVQDGVHHPSQAGWSVCKLCQKPLHHTQYPMLTCHAETEEEGSVSSPGNQQQAAQDGVSSKPLLGHTHYCHTNLTITFHAETEEKGSMLSPSNQQQAVQDGASSKPGRMYKYRRWLGYWNPGLNSIKTETELALHVSIAHSASKQHSKRDKGGAACKHCTLRVLTLPFAADAAMLVSIAHSACSIALRVQHCPLLQMLLADLMMSDSGETGGMT